MDLVLAICQGLGLALAIGIGGPIAALFASMMGALEAGFNPDGTDYSFITATWFLITLLAIAVLEVAARGRDFARLPIVALLAAAGGLAFAASLAEEGETAWPGLILGAIVTGATAYVSTGVLEGAIRRAKAAGGGRRGIGRDTDKDEVPPDVDAANVLIIGFAVAGIVVAALALFIPPLSLLAAIAVIAVGLGRRRKAGEKYEGLRILR